jgi:hypothetical protein
MRPVVLPLHERLVQAREAVMEGRYSSGAAALRWNVPLPLLIRELAPREAQGERAQHEQARPINDTVAVLTDPIPFDAAPEEDGILQEGKLGETERLQRQYDRILRIVKAAMEAGQTAQIAKHEYNLYQVGKALDAARAKDADGEARRRAAEVRDPVELAKKLLNSIDRLVALAPEEAKGAYERLKTVFGPR